MSILDLLGIPDSTNNLFPVLQGKGLMKTFWLEGRKDLDGGPIDVRRKTRNPSTVNLHNFSMEDFLGTGHTSVRSTPPDKSADKEHMAASRKADGSKSEAKDGGHSSRRSTTPEKPADDKLVSSRQEEGSRSSTTVAAEAESSHLHHHIETLKPSLTQAQQTARMYRSPTQTDDPSGLY